MKIDRQLAIITYLLNRDIVLENILLRNLKLLREVWIIFMNVDYSLISLTI
jgi:hypothetical protein